MSDNREFLHNILKIQYSTMGYLPNLPYHLISDKEMLNAFLSGDVTYGQVGVYHDENNNEIPIIEVTDIKNPRGFFIDNYPYLWDDPTLASVYKNLLVKIAAIIENFIFAIDLKEDLINGVGDVNFDGKLDNEDVRLIRAYIGGVISFSELQQEVADATKDGVVDVLDVWYIRRLISANTYSKLYSLDEIPDWVYSYMLGMVVGPYSSIQDRHNLLVLLDTDNIDDEFDLQSAQKCYETSDLWLKRTASSRKSYPTIFGEPHVFKALRLNKLSG